MATTDVAMTLAHSGNSSAGKNVPAFLLKLYNMVSDRSTDELIRWNQSGDSFLVLKHEDFAKDLLPRYYKHNNFSSFVRQLNMYGFHKIPHIEDNAFSKESSIWEFSNTNFHRDQPDLLCLVTRKKSGESSDKESLDYQTIMNEIHAIKRHQLTISQDLKRIQADNQALWQEQIDTRARHSRHQDTIDKILGFLQHVHGIGIQDKTLRSKKRKLLMNEAEDEYEGARIFDDEETQATFDDLFKSASTSPQLKPLRKPATDTASSKLMQNPENRFTLPNFEARKQAASNPPSSQQIRNMNKMKNSNSNPANKAISPYHNEDNKIVPYNGNAYNFDTSHLLPSAQTQIQNNNVRATEIEEDLALQDQNIEALASLLGLDPSLLDATNLDEASMNELGYGFDDFLNPSVAATPQELPDLNGKSNMHPPATTTKISSANSTPSGASPDESVEEIDMEKLRGKKRKVT